MRMTNLRTLRTARGLSRDALSRSSGVHSQTIASHEYGEKNDVTYSVAVKLAQALGVPTEELFFTPVTDSRISEAEQ